MLATPFLATAASADDFPKIVRTILDRQTDGPLAQMDSKRRSRMTDCVVDTLGDLPPGSKRKIVEAGNLEAQEHAFGQVVDEEHARWRKNIARACGQIATDT